MQQITCNAFLGGTHTVPLEKLVFRPAVYGIITYDGKMMVITNRRTGKLWPPGGGVDLGERMENALKREVREETGIEIAVDRFEGFEEKFFYYDPLDEAFHSLLFFYSCTPITFSPLSSHQVEDGEATNPRWVEIDNLKPDDFQDYGALLLNAANGSSTLNRDSVKA